MNAYQILLDYQVNEIKSHSDSVQELIGSVLRRAAMFKHGFRGISQRSAIDLLDLLGESNALE